MIAATLMFTASCKKENLNESASSNDPTISSAAKNQNAFKSSLSPWQMRSSGVSGPQRGIVEMSEAGQTTCYGVIYR